jgi:hypothetical protein
MSLLSRHKSATVYGRTLLPHVEQCSLSTWLLILLNGKAELDVIAWGNFNIFLIVRYEVFTAVTEEIHLVGCKNLVLNSQEKRYVSAKESSWLILCKI